MESKIFNISSINVSNKSKFIYELPSTYNNIKYLRILGIEIPHTIYTFSNIKNNLSFTITYDDIDYKISISEGNYTTDEIISEIQSKFNIINNTTTQDFEISLNSITNKINISNNKNNNFNLNFKRNENANNSYPNIGYYLGYKEELYKNITTITGLNQINLIDNNYIYLKINELLNIYDPLVHNSFCKIMLKNNITNTTYIREEDIIASKYIFRDPIDLKKLYIELVDYKNNLLTLSPFNVTITIELGYIYDSKLYSKLFYFANPLNFSSF